MDSVHPVSQLAPKVPAQQSMEEGNRRCRVEPPLQEQQSLGSIQGERLSPSEGKGKAVSSSSSSSSTTSSSAGKTRCSSCNVKFESEAELQNHVQTVHREQTGDSNSGQLKTPQVSPMPRTSPSQTEEVCFMNSNNQLIPSL